MAVSKNRDQATGRLCRHIGIRGQEAAPEDARPSRAVAQFGYPEKKIELISWSPAARLKEKPPDFRSGLGYLQMKVFRFVIDRSRVRIPSLAWLMNKGICGDLWSNNQAVSGCDWPITARNGIDTSAIHGRTESSDGGTQPQSREGGLQGACPPKGNRAGWDTI